MIDGAKVRKRREKKGLTQDQLAAACGVTNGTVRNWENGRAYPGRGRLPLLLSNLGCEYRDLLP